MRDVLDGLAQQLFPRVTQHVAELLIEIHQHAVEIHASQADRRLLEGLAETPFGLPRPFFRLFPRDAQAQVDDAVRDIAGEFGQKGDFLLVERVGLARIDGDRAEYRTPALERQRDRGLEIELQRALAAARVAAIVQDVARNVRLARGEDFPHESLIAAIRAPGNRRAHGHVTSKTGVRDDADHALVFPGGIAHPGHLVPAGLRHDTAHSLQHPCFVVGMYKDVVAIRHHTPGARQPRQPRLGAFALGYVLDDLDQVTGTRRRAAGERNGAIDPEFRSVLSHVPLFGGEGQPPPGEQLLPERILLVTVVRMGKVARRQHHQLGEIVAEHLAQPAVGLQEGALRSRVCNADCGMLERRAKTLLAFLQRTLAFDDIRRRSLQALALSSSPGCDSLSARFRRWLGHPSSCMDLRTFNLHPLPGQGKETRAAVEMNAILRHICPKMLLSAVKKVQADHSPPIAFRCATTLRPRACSS